MSFRAITGREEARHRAPRVPHLGSQVNSNHLDRRGVVRRQPGAGGDVSQQIQSLSQEERGCAALLEAVGRAGLESPPQEWTARELADLAHGTLIFRPPVAIHAKHIQFGFASF